MLIICYNNVNDIMICYVMLINSRYTCHVFALFLNQRGVAAMFLHAVRRCERILFITTIDRDCARLDNCNNYEK